VHNAAKQDQPFRTVNSPMIRLIAGKVSIKYLALCIDWGLALLMVPFNLAHLGQSTYGLWMLIASIPVYFSFLDLGYTGAMVKFAAQYRAHGDSRALNEIASTIYLLFAGVGLLAYAVAVLLAFNIEALLRLTPEQARIARQVLLIISIYVALGFPCSVFGAVVRGFMDPYMTSIISIATSISVVIVNVSVLLAGYDIVTLVAAITAVRALSYVAYWRNAHRVFPALRIRLKAFRINRLREITGFSAALLFIDLANKLNYSTDAIVVGAFMNVAAVASWTIAQRPADLTQRLSNELNIAVFPFVVDSAALGRDDRLRAIFLHGTRLSLAIVILMSIGLIVLARPLITLWVGPGFGESAGIIYVLAFVAMIRVGCSGATTLLEGAGRHYLLAVSTTIAGVANLLLSIFLVQRYGLLGVALGTLIPLSVVSLFVIFPAACRRIDLSLSRALLIAVLPATWPALLIMVFLVIVRSFVANNFYSAAFQAIAAGLFYILIFLGLAISREERQLYLIQARQLFRPNGVRAAA
jgi:O-antigen/teichoic acid export membrane protein